MIQTLVCEFCSHSVMREVRFGLFRKLEFTSIGKLIVQQSLVAV